MSAVVFEDQLEIPLGIRNLRDFRKWMRSPEFPEQGRIDYIDGKIEVNVSPRDFFSHSGPADAIATCLTKLVRDRRLGYVRIGQTRYVNVVANLSCEPDLLFVSYESLKSKRTCFVSEQKGASDDYLELDGAIDLVVEILGYSTAAKDTRRLPAAYFAAGVTEFWLVDARDTDELTFHIHRRGKAGFQRVRPAADGFQKSKVFERSFQLLRKQDDIGLSEFELRMH